MPASHRQRASEIAGRGWSLTTRRPGAAVAARGAGSRRSCLNSLRSSPSPRRCSARCGVRLVEDQLGLVFAYEVGEVGRRDLTRAAPDGWKKTKRPLRADPGQTPARDVPVGEAGTRPSRRVLQPTDPRKGIPLPALAVRTASAVGGAISAAVPGMHVDQCVEEGRRSSRFTSIRSSPRLRRVSNAGISAISCSRSLLAMLWGSRSAPGLR